jgi:benzoyl-CoA 2,3-dioxygenase component B
MAATFTTETITPKYHDAIVDWQQRNFSDLAILEKYWGDYFKGVPPFQLVAKVGHTKSDTIEWASTRAAAIRARQRDGRQHLLQRPRHHPRAVLD